MRMQIEAVILSVGAYCTGLGQLNDCYNICYFPKSAFILVQCNTSLSKIMLHIQ